MNESERKYHPVSAIFPMMTEQELKASALIGSHIASIFPSMHKGYFYITHVDGPTGVYEYLDKPVKKEYIVAVFSAMGIDATKGKWRTEKCKPFSKAPYSEPHQSKNREQLVYFISGAGWLK